MPSTPSRRSLLASAGTVLAGFAGCSGGDSGTEGSPDRTTTATPGTGTPSRTVDAPPVDWDGVAPFRTWLTDHTTLPSSNYRFDYQRTGLEDLLGTGRVSVFDLSAAEVSGFLTQSGNAIYLGSFDGDALAEALASSSDHERTGSHAGYATATSADGVTEFAVGDDAVLAGSDLDAWIDAHRGERPRLEEVYPVFTLLLSRLAARGIVTAQLGPPTGSDLPGDAVYAWGNAMAAADADEATWVYVTADSPTESLVADIEATLADSPLVAGVDDVTVEGRVVTLVGTPAAPE